ncbi:MAG: hypothetical protein AAF228_00895 [Pseudomonadota bacterium]
MSGGRVNYSTQGALHSAWQETGNIARKSCFFKSIALGALKTIFVLFLLTQSVHAIDANIEAEQRNGYGRLIFNFQDLPGYSHTVTGSIFILKFSEKINTIVDKIPELLKDYVDVARIDPDGKAVRIAFNSIYKVNIMEAGPQLFVDILPSSWVGAPPPLPTHILKELGRIAAEAKKRAEEEARQIEESKKFYRMKVRVARNKTFSRIAFEWNKFVTVKMTREGTRVLIKFGRRANVKLNRLRANPPPYLKNISRSDVPGGMNIEMTISSEANVRGFREGNSYIVDLSGPESDLDLSAQKFEEKIKDTLKQNDKDKKENVPEELKIAKETNEEKLEDESDPERTIEILEVPFAVKQLEFNPKKLDSFKFGDLDGAKNNSETEFSQIKGWGKVVTPKEQAEDLKVQTEQAAEAKKKAEAIRARKAKIKKKNDENDDTDVGILKEEDPIITASAIKRNDSVIFSFPFQKSVATAVFRRHRTLYIAFDTDKEIEIDKIQGANDAIVQSIEQKDITGLKLITVKLTKPWLTYANYEDGKWDISVGNMIAGKVEPLHLKRTLRNDKRSIILVNYKKAGRVHWIKDEEVGDDIAIVTGIGPSHAIVKPQEFVEFNALPTANGMALVPSSDDLLVRLRVDDVMITRRSGLTISAGGAAQYIAGRKPLDGKKNGQLGFIDFRGWQQGGKHRFKNRSGELERAAAAADKKDKNKIRLDLARLYIAHELAPETLGVIRQILSSDSDAKADPALNILRGVANTMLKRNNEARQDLDLHSLSLDRHASLWRGLLAVNEKKWAEALKQFSEGMNEIESYPFHLQAKFRLAEAEAALALKKLKRAADTLDAMPGIVLPTSLEMKSDLMRGRYLQLIGRTQQALELYERIMQGDVGKYFVEAQYHRIKLKLDLKLINIAQAITEFERLSVVWRGDETELKTLKQLARLYVRQEKYRPAFQIMKNTLISFPAENQALEIQDEMKSVFSDLFLYGKGENMTPVSALGLYYDYKELTPIGRLGDELIRRLAQRLTQVDLLDQAAELLDYQVKNRLKGIARSQVATRLAMIQLMDRKPTQALKTIRDTRQPDLPKDLKRRRDMLEARSLGEIGRFEGAIEVLNSIDGVDVIRLRADAYWTAQRWQQAGEELEKMLGKRWQSNEPLSDTERFDVLRAAISYSLAEDQFALDRLRRKFYNMMIKTVDAETFVLVTRSITNKGKDFKELAKEIASVDTLDAFMKEFQARYDRTDTRGEAAQTSSKDQPAKPLG